MFNHSPAIFFWFKDNASDLLYEHNLSPDSVVVEVGAYVGDWCVKIYNRFKCKILAFEPVNEYFIQLQNNISYFENIELYNFGLGSKNEKISSRMIYEQQQLWDHFSQPEMVVDIMKRRTLLMVLRS